MADTTACSQSIELRPLPTDEDLVDTLEDRASSVTGPAPALNPATGLPLAGSTVQQHSLRSDKYWGRRIVGAICTTAKWIFGQLQSAKGGCAVVFQDVRGLGENVSTGTARAWSSLRQRLTLSAYINTCLTFFALIAAIIMIPATFKALEATIWSAKKDYVEHCQGEKDAGRDLTQDCIKALEMSLPPPPFWHLKASDEHTKRSNFRLGNLNSTAIGRFDITSASKLLESFRWEAQYHLSPFDLVDNTATLYIVVFVVGRILPPRVGDILHIRFEVVCIPLSAVVSKFASIADWSCWIFLVSLPPSFYWLRTYYCARQIMATTYHEGLCPAWPEGHIEEQLITCISAFYTFVLLIGLSLTDQPFSELFIAACAFTMLTISEVIPANNLAEKRYIRGRQRRNDRNYKSSGSSSSVHLTA